MESLLYPQVIRLEEPEQQIYLRSLQAQDSLVAWQTLAPARGRWGAQARPLWTMKPLGAAAFGVASAAAKAGKWRG